MAKIEVILGKRGSGKSTLSKELMRRAGGRVVFLSPVENLKADFTAWEYAEIKIFMEKMKGGQILVVRRADIKAAEIVALTALSMPKQKFNFTLVVDEMDKYNKSTEMLDIIHYGRHFNINLICNSRRYTDLPRLLTSQADNMYIFRTQEPRDIQYIKDYCGHSAASKIVNLKPFHYLIYPDEEIKKTIA